MLPLWIEYQLDQKKLITYHKFIITRSCIYFEIPSDTNQMQTLKKAACFSEKVKYTTREQKERKIKVRDK